MADIISCSDAVLPSGMVAGALGNAQSASAGIEQPNDNPTSANVATRATLRCVPGALATRPISDFVQDPFPELSWNLSGYLCWDRPVMPIASSSMPADCSGS